MAKQKIEIIDYVLKLFNERTTDGVRVHKNAVIISKVKEQFHVDISRGAIYYWDELYGSKYKKSKKVVAEPTREENSNE